LSSRGGTHVHEVCTSAMFNNNYISFFVIFVLLVKSVSGDQSTTTISSSNSETTVTLPTHTDLSQKDIDEALFLDHGEYSTMSFQYVNDQFLGWRNKDSIYTCYDDFIKCTISQTLVRDEVWRLRLF
ncbi:hypothetical protein ACJJTC_014159, partial [Scirpophaga incertulas]